MKKLFILLPLIIIMQALFLSKEIAYGESISSLDEKIAAIKKENLSLEAEIASKTSLNNLSTKASGLGLDPVMAMSNSQSTTVALRR